MPRKHRRVERTTYSKVRLCGSPHSVDAARIECVRLPGHQGSHQGHLADGRVVNWANREPERLADGT